MKLSFVNRIKESARILATGSVSTHIEDFLSGNDVSTGGLMTTDLAMKYSAVSACVRVLAETTASVPLILYKKTDKGREISTELDIHDIIRYRPNEYMSPFNFMETLITNFATSGNVVCEKVLNKNKQLIGLHPYPYNMVEIERKGKDLIYKITGDDKKTKTLTREQVLHIPNLSFDGMIGLSPIQYAAESIKLGLSYEKSQVKLYENGVTPTGIFETDQPLSEKSVERLKKDLIKNYAGLKNTGKPMVLEEGLKWNQITINPIDAQLLQNKYFQIEDICRIYRVPQHLVNKLDRSTFDNIEHLSLEFVMYTMLPIFKRFEDNFNRQILTLAQQREGYYLEFKIDGLLRGDAKSRAEAYSIGRMGGWWSVNDIRKLENLSPIKNGDIYLQPMNYIEAGKEIDQAQNKVIEDFAGLLKERG